jgi:hypothetical protein
VVGPDMPDGFLLQFAAQFHPAMVAGVGGIADDSHVAVHRVVEAGGMRFNPPGLVFNSPEQPEAVHSGDMKVLVGAPKGRPADVSFLAVDYLKSHTRNELRFRDALPLPCRIEAQRKA